MCRLQELGAAAVARSGEEAWGSTSLAPSVNAWRSNFLDGLAGDNREELAKKARAAAAAPSLAW